MPDEDLLLDSVPPEFGSGVIGVCDICGQRQAVIVLAKERYKLCVLDFENKAWIRSTARPGVPALPFTSTTELVPSRAVRTGQVRAVVLSPTKVVKRPSAIVVPDVYGLTAQALEAGVRLAHEGFEVILPDFTRLEGMNLAQWARMRVSRTLSGGVHISQSRRELALRILEDCRRYVRERPMVLADKQALFGFSYSGAWALAYAAETPEIAAVALAYPRMVHPPGLLENVRGPVYAVYGDQDSTAGDDCEQLREAARIYGIPLEISVLPGAGHHFLNRDLRAYRPGPAEEAWTRLVGFLKGRLFPTPKPPPTPPVGIPGRTSATPSRPTPLPTPSGTSPPPSSGPRGIPSRGA